MMGNAVNLISECAVARRQRGGINPNAIIADPSERIIIEHQELRNVFLLGQMASNVLLSWGFCADT